MRNTLNTTTDPYRRKAAKDILQGKVDLRMVTRLLKKIDKLQGKAWLVGGVITEGYSNRDIDFVISDKRDIPIIKKALGSLGDKAHFLIKQRPSGSLILEIANTKVE